MSLFADVERLLERVFERTSARLFRTRLQAVQLERRVERAMELARVVEGGRATVPDAIRVRLLPADLRSAAGDTGGAEALASRLADTALAFARRNRYHLQQRPTVQIVVDPSLPEGRVEVEARFGERTPRALHVEPPGDAPAGPPADAPAEPPVRATPDADPEAPPVVVASSTATALPAPPAGPPPDAEAAVPAVTEEPVDAGAPIAPIASPEIPAAPEPTPWVTAGVSIRGDGDPTRTMVYRRPAPAPPRAILREIRRDGRERTIEVGSTILEVGRAKDCDIVLDDPRVSRRHGRLQARRGALVYTDLGSTNGSRVNGTRVDEIALGFGDRLQLGDTVLVVETLPG